LEALWFLVDRLGPFPMTIAAPVEMARRDPPSTPADPEGALSHPRALGGSRQIPAAALRGALEIILEVSRITCRIAESSGVRIDQRSGPQSNTERHCRGVFDMDANAVSLLFAVVGGSIFLGLVGIVGGFLHYRRERLLTHQERMKALELGREMPDDAATARIRTAFGHAAGASAEQAPASLPHKCFSTALWVAFWGFLAASQGGWVNQSIAIAIAISVAAIGVTAFICGTTLAMNTPSAAEASSSTKQRFDADAFDFVSRRG
jgi:hypothetical protein